MFFSALNVKYRDIKYTIPFLVQILLFVSPVHLSREPAAGEVCAILRLNPLVGILDAFRAAALPAQRIDWNLLGLATLISLLCLGLASIHFYKTEREFADII
jgi:lipopolysaccharide transport system permease protein